MRQAQLVKITEARIGDDGVELGLLSEIEFAQEATAVGQSVNFELLILHTVQQYVHAGEDGVSVICSCVWSTRTLASSEPS